jgi:hypothetical protein
MAGGQLLSLLLLISQSSRCILESWWLSTEFGVTEQYHRRGVSPSSVAAEQYHRAVSPPSSITEQCRRRAVSPSSATELGEQWKRTAKTRGGEVLLHDAVVYDIARLG